MSVVTLAPAIAESTGCARADAPIGSTFPGVLVAAKVGADWAWTLLYRSLAPAVLGYLTASGSARPDDDVGSVFRDAALQIHNFAGTEEMFRMWIFQLAHERLDSRSHERLSMGRDATVEYAMDRLTPEAQLALTVLPADQRAIVLLRAFGGLTTREVAAVVGRSLRAVEGLQRRAYALLRHQLPLCDLPQPSPRCLHHSH